MRGGGIRIRALSWIGVLSTTPQCRDRGLKMQGHPVRLRAAVIIRERLQCSRSGDGGERRLKGLDYLCSTYARAGAGYPKEVLVSRYQSARGMEWDGTREI